MQVRPLTALILSLALSGCQADLLPGGDPGAFRDGGSTTADADDAPGPTPDLLPAAPPPDLLGGPPYPIVLAHGAAGFRNIGPIDYFYGVADALRKDGHDVWISQVDPLNTAELRGPQLRAYVQMVLERTGKAKVNLVGHSHGGFDVRFVASELGERVASVTMLASPMKGAPVADVALGVIPGPVQSAIALVANLYGLAAGGYTSDVKAQLMELTTPGAAAFFARHPDDPRVAYYSITGRSERASGDLDCATATPAPFVTRWNQSLDPLNPLFAVTALIMDGMRPRPTHDGLVTVASARHGMFLGCIPADHLDEIGLPPGTGPGAGNSFDHLRFYRDLADWLVQHGH